jgi:hypothetical protein
MNFSSFADAEVSKVCRPQKLKKQADPISRNVAPSATNEPLQHEVATHLAFQAEEALARVKGDRELLRQMAGVFAMQWNSLWVEIFTACQSRHGATLQMAANKLKRSVESFGAGETSRVAQELEVLGSQSDFRDVHKTCARLKSEIERLVNALKYFTNPAAAPTSDDGLQMTNGGHD